MADFHSWCFTENTEWALNTDVFLLLPNIFFQPEIDLFASALNHQIPTYISWLPNPNAYAVNAFTVSWTDLQFYAPMDNPVVVSSSVEPTHPTPSADCSTQGSTSHSASTPHGPPTLRETIPPGFSLLPTAATLIKKSWRPGTRVQYDSLLRRWTRFCTSRQVHPMSPTIYDILAYLTSMFERGLAYRTIYAVKSGILASGILNIPGVTAISEHPLVILLLKGIFHVRPPRPHYELIWDTDLVLSYLKNLSSSKYSLKFLSLKVVTLLTLLSGQRVSTVHQFCISQMQTTPSLIIFNIPGLLKHSRHTKRDNPIPFHAFNHDADLCPVATINQNITAWATLANYELHDALLLCYRKPHGPTTKDTLARWVRSVLKLSGVDTDTFAAHSCRSAPTSKAMSSGVALDVILKAGQWSADPPSISFTTRILYNLGTLWTLRLQKV